MSSLYFKSRFKWNSFPLYLVLVVTLILNLSHVKCFSCDTVASLPPNMDILLPQYEKLNRIHLSNYFFLEEKLGVLGIQPQVFTLNLHRKSLFKLQVVPKHMGVEVKVKINSYTYILETSPHIPIDFTEYQAINPGPIEISFTSKENYADEIVSDLRHRATHDAICDQPYVHVQIYIEDSENFSDRLSAISKEAEAYEEFEPQVKDLLDKIIDLQSALHDDKSNRVKDLKLDLKEYKLTLPHEEGLQYYWKYNVSVLNVFDLNIPEEKIDSYSEELEHQFVSIYHKYALKFQLFVDFFLGGSLHLLLIRERDLDKLTDLNCLSDATCIISEVPHKNSMLLEGILTPGDYKVLLINMNFNYYIKSDAKNLRKSLKLDAIPISAKFKLKKFVEEENRYNCDGRHLPSNFDYLMYPSKLAINNLQQNYFEFKGEIVMNLKEMKDSVEFSLEEESFIRVATFHDEGVNVSIELYELEALFPSQVIHVISSSGSGELGKILSEAINASKGNPLSHKDKTSFLLTKSMGEHSGLIYPLFKNRKYRLVFNYEGSMFEENERKSCEMYYVKIAIDRKDNMQKVLHKDCSPRHKLTEVQNLLNYLERNHASNEETSYISPDPIVTPLKVGEKNTIISHHNFEIKESISLNLDVISDFISSYVVPVIIPVDSHEMTEEKLEDILHHKYKMLTLHDNSIKVKLNKGKYMLILLNGVSQMYSNDELSRLVHPITSVIQCISFKISFHAIKLSGESLSNWDCNSVHYSILPDNLNDLMKFDQTHFTYHNKHMLLPGVNPKKPYMSTKIKTYEHGYILRLIGEYIEKNHQITESHEILDITLNRSNKVVQTAKPKIIEKEFKTDQQYLNYYLKPRTEYELKFETDTNLLSSSSYFESCRLFKLEITLIREDALDNRENETCEENTPSIENVVYERIIGTNGSFYKYGSKSPLQIFTSFTANRNESPKQEARDNYDLEYVHPRSSLFIYKFDPSKNKSAHNFKYDFEVKSNYAMATILLEVPYSSLIGFSAKIFRKLNEGHELMAAEDMEEEGLFTIRGLLLESGKYTVVFYPNTQLNKLDFFNASKSLCATFSASVLIENKPYDFLQKGLNHDYEACPYLGFPENLNVPGWVAADTGYTINEYFRFKIKKSVKVKRFSVKERSIFKFYIPDEYSGLFSYISLFKIKANKKKQLVETFEKENNYINTVVEKGTYQFEFKFKLIEETELNKVDEMCQFYDVHIAIIPVSTIIPGIDTLNENNKNTCDEKYLNFNNNELKPGSSMEFGLMTMRNMKVEHDKVETYSSVKKIKLLPANNRGKFIAEIIFNYYIDGLYVFNVYQVTPGKSEITPTFTEVPSEIVHSENFVWVVFHFGKMTEYEIEIVTGNSDNFSNCGNIRFSYNYEEFTDDINSQNAHSQNQEYLNKKDACGIEDHLPHSFFDNKNNKLDKYGGPQSETNGELNFFGEFLLPKTMTKIRTDFIIKQKSILYLRIIPKYTDFKSNFLQMEIFHDKTILFRMGHDEYKGVFMYELDHSPYDFMGNSNHHSTVYFLDITFDRVLLDCESFEFVFNITPKDLYTEEYLACDTETQTIPDVLTIDTNGKYNYISHLKLGDSSSQFKIDEDNNYLEKKIKLVLTKPTSIEIILEYIISDNMMDIAIEKEGEEDDFEVGEEKIESSLNSNGITSKKEISVDLKKGTYIVTIVYHQLFTEMLKKFYTVGELQHLCFSFGLSIEAYVYKNLKNDSNFSTEGENNNDPEIHHLTKDDFEGINGKNLITLVDPPEHKNIKLNRKFNIELKFAFDLEKQTNNDYYNRMVYLQDSSTKIGMKIYPSSVKEINHKSIVFVFDSSKDFNIKKCYRLFMDDLYKIKFNDESLEQIQDTYCTINCECNSNADYKCSNQDKCICHAPYTGTHCENCLPGYAMNLHKKCVDEKLLNMKCEEKKTCSGHGTCLVSTFDAYAVSAKPSLHPCKCDDGFSSYNTPYGEAMDVFCDSCKNPSKTYPFCSPKHGNAEEDSIDFTFDSGCADSDGALRLPQRLFSYDYREDSPEKFGSDFSYIDGGQDVDGSLDLLAIYNIKQAEEITEFMIPEDSIIRVLYESKEINRAKVMILQNKYNVDSIAFSEGVNSSESFIAKLDAKDSPYYIKIMHSNLKSQCNKYRLKIVIKTFKTLQSELKCHSYVNYDNISTLLPPSNYALENIAGVYSGGNLYYLPDNLIFLPDNKTQKGNYDYTQAGVLSKAATDEDFVYNIRLEVKTPMTFSASVLFDFLESDFSLVLRDKTTKILANGEWLIPEENFHTGDHDFITAVNTLLDPGVYYLTLVQNISANHLMQIIYANENLNEKSHSSGIMKKNSQHINRCFKFKFNIQTIPINKPDPSLSTSKYESMFNRLVNVEPESFSKINVEKKFEIFLTFEAAISSNLLKHPDEKSDRKLSFRDAFYFENTRNKNKIPVSHAYLQGTLSKTFLILFEENILQKDECYELKYNLDILQSSYDRERKVTSDSPIVHKYCTKNCDCNPHTDFECDEQTGKCICEEPYQGEGCFSCIDGWVMMRGKCITQHNCRNKFCSGHGKCSAENTSTNSHKQNSSKCECDTGFTSIDCSVCSDRSLTYPDCHPITKDSVEAKVDTSDMGKFIELDAEDFSEEDSEIYQCDHPFVPHNLDTLGFLHLDGSLHINGKYSLKHINNKHYSMGFTPKEKSHVKLFLEHTKITHVVAVFLLDHNKKEIHSGTIDMGPAGYGSSTFIDFVIDPIKNPNDNSFSSYELKLFIKDFPMDETDLAISYDENETLDNSLDECFTVYLELQIMPTAKELEMIHSMNSQSPHCANNEENIPRFLSGLSNFDLHALDYNKDQQQFKEITHIRNLESSAYFHYEYMYVPDLLDKQFVLNIEINSKFINSHVGVLLEIVDIPTHEIKINHSKLTAKMIEDIVEKDNNGKRLHYPVCDSHCFSGIKKFNSVYLSRELPTDTFVRIWWYDANKSPMNLSSSNDYTFNKCLDFEVKVYFSHVEGSEDSLIHKNSSSLCSAKELPTDLNNKDYLGDRVYIKKWGFHLLDYFRIDKSIEKGLKHQIFFEIQEFHLLRLLIFNGRIDTDLEIFSILSEDVLIAKSSAKNFEDVIVLEIPPGKYKIEFKFFPPVNGFHKCESIKMEFAMENFGLLQPKIDKMIEGRKTNTKVNTIDISEHLAQFGKDILTKDPQTIRYNIEMLDPFVINVDDPKKYESSVSISDYTFVIKPEDNNKLEIIAFVNSDFLYVDANVYLSTFADKENSKNSKISAGKHKKNLNLLFSGTLESGTYVLSLRYYRRLRYKIANNHSHDSIVLKNGNKAEIEFDAMFINKSQDIVNIDTSKGSLKIQPASNNSNSISHNWFCRSVGLPIPKSLSSLRFLQFSTDSHILGNYLVPAMGLGEEVIKFKISTPGMMIRIYVECHDTDMDVKLIEKTLKGDKKIVAHSKGNIHFETIMELIYENRDYELVLKFNGFNEAKENSQTNLSNACLTFKMEIAVEKQHNYACPINSKYSLLTDLKPIPALLPVKDAKNSKIYRYDSKSIYLGDSKNSGFVYMIRKDQDETIKYADFTVESEIDLKIEITNDFLQAPVNIFLTANTDSEHPSVSSNANKFGLAKKALGIEDAFIIAYGEIYENRSTLLIKNLPKGSYKVYLFLPRLKSKFMFNPRVCSIYDILVEAKKSRNHFREKEIVKLAEIDDEVLDPPVFLPQNLYSSKFMKGEENYINYFDRAYMHHIPSDKGNELTNTIAFKLKEESVVTLNVYHDLYNEHIEVSIDGQTQSADIVSKVLKPGDYKAIIKLKDIHINNDAIRQQLKSNHYLMMLFIGISPKKRVEEIYSYNSLQSLYKQCVSTPFPSSLDYDQKTHTYSYHNEFFKFSRRDLIGLKLGEFTVNLSSSNNNNRIIAEIGSDYTLNQLSLKIKSEHKEWQTFWKHNVGDLDILVPKGRYTFEFSLDDKIELDNLDCIIFSLDINIIDNDFLSQYTEKAIHPLYSSRVFDTNKTGNKLLAAKCEGTMLPLELHKQSPTDYHKINENGDYLLHINKALYFVDTQHSLKNENLNEVSINLDEEISLVRIRTLVEKPSEYQIISRMKLYSEMQNPPTMVNYTPDLSYISHNMKERNNIWFLSKNKDLLKEYYILELIQEKYEEFSPASPNYYCPNYTLDILIQSISEIVSRLECPKSQNELLSYTLPVTKIPPFKTGGTIKTDSKSYHEKIDFGYFTEKQFSESFLNNESFTGFQYGITFTIEGDNEYHFSMEFGYDQVVSLFDIYLSKYEDNDVFENRVVSVSEPFFDKGNVNLPYKRIINTNVTKGKYVILIVENIWDSIIRTTKIHSKQENINLCLPFGYALDIVPANDKTSAPEIISVFPPGPITFLSVDEDLNVKVILSKPPFTKNHQPITHINNFMNIINSFYLVKKSSNKSSQPQNFNEDKQTKIYPSKMEGSVNNKEWTILFLKEHFEPNFDYQLTFDNNWMYDVNYSPYKCGKPLTTVRVEVNRESIFQMVDNFKTMKEKMNNSDFKVEKEEANTPPAPKIIAEESTKCGKHGKLIYDNILRQSVCTCFDGFTGKFCNICDGTYDKNTNRCIFIDDDDDDRDSAALNEPPSEHISTTYTPHAQDASQTYKTCLGGCVNGYCDVKIGKCICEMNWTGARCEKPISHTSSDKGSITKEVSTGLVSILFKLIIGLALIWLLYYVYSLIKKNYLNSSSSNVEYNPLPTSEYELGGHSINNNEDMELIHGGGDRSVVEYEMSPIGYKNDVKTKSKREKSNEL